MAEPISPAELYRRMGESDHVTVIDVRFAQIEEIPGSVHVPVTDLEDKEWHWDPDYELVVFCQHGRGASDYAAEVLEEQGYRHVRTLAGGMDAYLEYLHGLAE